MGQTNVLRPLGISVIICCYNSQHTIYKVLESLENQKGIDFFLEIIVVNNNSKDRTANEIERFIKKSDLNIIPFFEPKAGLMYARENGLKNSQYEYIQFCDDDNLLSANYLSSVFQIFNQNSKIGACGGKGIELIANTSMPKWFKNYKKSYAVGSQVRENQNHLYGAGMAVRFSALNKIYERGFTSYLTGRKGNLLLAGDDGELILALLLCGYKLKASDEFYFYHVIAKDRLEKQYLYQLHEGFGAMYPVIDIYRYAQRNKNVKSITFHKLNFYLKILKSFLSLFFKYGIEWRVQFSLFKGHLNGYKFFKKDYEKIINVVSKLIN
jgi:glycosyltransferase involved in cell wall biosynthesis